MNPKETLMSAFQNAFFYKLTSVVIFFCSSIIVFRYFGPENRGEIAILLSPILIAQLALFDGGTKVQDAISKGLKIGSKSDYSILWSSYILKLISYILLGIILFFLGPHILVYYGLEVSREIYTLCSFLFVLNLLNGPVDLNFLQASKKYSELRVFGILESSGPLFSILITLLLGQGIETYIYIYTASRLILAPYALNIMLKEGLLKFLTHINFSECISILRFTFPLWIAAFLSYGTSQFIPLISGLFFELNTIGNIALALGVSSLTISFITFGDGFALPKINENIIYRNIKRNQIHYLLRFWQVLFYVSSIAAISIFLLSDFIVLIIGGSQYQEASDILKWLTILISLRSLGVLRTILYLLNETEKVVLYSGLRMFIEISLSFIIFEYLGPEGISFSLSLGLLAYGYILINKLGSEDKRFKRILRKILFSQIIFALALISINMLIKFSFTLAIILGILLLVLLIFFALNKKKQILRILQS